MAVEDQCFQGMFYLMLLLQAAAGISQLVRVGDKATLICGNVQENAADCENTTWMFTGTTRESLELVSLGNVQGKQNHRISLSENCSLLIPKVQDRDAGVYYCQQFSSGVKQRPDALVYLSVVTLVTWRFMDEAKMSCCVKTYLDCSHRVTWFFNKVQLVESDNLKISASPCCTVAKTLTSHDYYRSRERSLTCEIRNKSNQTAQSFRFKASGRVASTEAPAAIVSSRGTETSATLTGRRAGGSSGSPINVAALDFWWVSVIAAAVFVAFLAIVVIVLKRRNVKATRMNNNNRWTAATYSTPEMGPEMVDAEDSVSYAAIVIKSQGKAQERRQRKNDDPEGDRVIYTTVKASSSTLSVPTI